MAFGKLETGLIIGTFVGNLVGSGVTILVMKKLKKLEYKRDLEAQQKQYEEVYAFYNNKIEELKKLKNGVDYAAVEVKKSNEKLEKLNKMSSSTSTVKVTADGRIDEEAYKSPKTLMQERQAAEDNAKVPIFDSDRERKIGMDYAKISREKYSNLTKEYDREELDIEPIKYPEQITMDEFEDEIAYRKETLIYYEQDGVFAGLDDIPVNDLYDEQYFGADNLLLFGSMQASLDGKSSTNELYLRDRIHNVDFHLIYEPIRAFSDIEKAGLDNSD